MVKAEVNQDSSFNQRQNSNYNQRNGDYSDNTRMHRNNAAAVSDMELQRSVRSELNGTWWSNYPDIRAEVNDGVVILRGTVPSSKDVVIIEDRLSGVQGVRNVRTELQIQNQ